MTAVFLASLDDYVEFYPHIYQWLPHTSPRSDRTTDQPIMHITGHVHHPPTGYVLQLLIKCTKLTSFRPPILPFLVPDIS